MTSRIRVAIVVAAWLVVLSPHTFAQSAVSIAPPALQDLSGIAQLQSLFDSDRDNVRVVLLLSPT
jgi:hypothetical protein